jgi:glycosyltransferase involved in cell wall biosynthesis
MLPLSVVMPVYNTAPWLAAAVQSILDQSFGDFEFLIINDGSTDQTLEVLGSFSDPRIRLVNNDGNRGVIYSLNRGIDLAQGAWIARMDGDDISLPDRFSKQMDYLRLHPEVDLLATRVKLIDQDGYDAGVWRDDKEVIDEKQILGHLPLNNCIAHPSVMVRAELMRSFRYRAEQLHSEDYDLWMRLAASGKILVKLDEELVLHRIHRGSVTRGSQQNVFRKLADAKKKFVDWAEENGIHNEFIRITKAQARWDVIRARIKSIVS